MVVRLSRELDPGRGEPRSEVGRVTVHTRKTIGRYVKRAEQLGWRPGMLVTCELAGTVARASSVTRERAAGEGELLRRERRAHVALHAAEAA